MKICHIVGAGEMYGAKVLPNAGDLVIAADAGYAPLIRQGVTPHLVVGDFDSLGEVPAGENIVRHPVMKDDTDMMLAINIALARGFTEFRLYGALGGRLDHTLANLQALQYIANRGGRGFAVGNVCTVAIREGELRFRADAVGVVSVFALGAPAQVDIEGLLYPLNNYALLPDFPIGVSNEFTGTPACVRVREGCAVLIFGSLAFIEE